MKKKKTVKQSPDSVDYEVGLVSGSLSKSRPSPGSGSLSALFSSTTAPASVLFQPAPEIIKSVEPREKQKELKVQNEKKVQVKEKSAADLRLESREQSLTEADEEEKQASVKQKKSRPSSHDEEEQRGPEFWVQQRQRLKQNKRQNQLQANRTVFVGNLPLSCTKKTLRSLFKDKGTIESIRFRSLVREDPSMSRRAASIMRKAHPQKQSVNAYVVFKEEQSATDALDRNGLELEKEFIIRVDRVKDGGSHDHKRSIFVGNLSFDLKELSLRRHFEECGSVEAVRLVRDQNSGLGKGFGYVLFQSADSVQLALKLDGSKLEGRSIRVKRSVKRDKKQTLGTKTGPRNRPGSKSGFKSRSGSFTGEKSDPRQKKKKALKKKPKRKKKTVHI